VQTVAANSVQTIFTLKDWEGNFSFHGDTGSISQGITYLTIPEGAGGLYFLSSCSYHPAGGANQHQLFQWISTTRGSIWHHGLLRVNPGDTGWMGCSGTIVLKDGDTISCWAQNSSTGTHNFYFGDATNGTCYGLFIVRMSPVKNVISNITSSPVTIA
jgi:hypothetical protein